MNRVTRDYCSKGLHPRWRGWTAKYSHEPFPPYRTPWAGNYCDFCGKPVHKAVGTPPNPAQRTLAQRLRFTETNQEVKLNQWPRQ